MPEIMDESLNMLGRYLGGFFWFYFMCPGFVSPHLLSFKMLMLSWTMALLLAAPPRGGPRL